MKNRLSTRPGKCWMPKELLVCVSLSWKIQVEIFSFKYCGNISLPNNVLAMTQERIELAYWFKIKKETPFSLNVNTNGISKHSTDNPINCFLLWVFPVKNSSSNKMIWKLQTRTLNEVSRSRSCVPSCENINANGIRATHIVNPNINFEVGLLLII